VTLASVFAGPSAAGVAAIAVATFAVARRSWALAVLLVVAADALTWSWIDGLKNVGNILYWGATLGMTAGLIVLARSSATARALLFAAAAVTMALAATVAWSFMPHVTIRQAGTFGSVLVVVAFAVVHVRAEGAGSDRLAHVLGWIVPGALLLTALVVLFDRTAAVAKGGGVSGFINGPNTLGIVVALGMGFALSTPMVEGRPSLMLALVAVVAFVVTLSASRTGMLASLLALVVYEIGGRRWRRLAAATAVTVVAAILAAQTVPNVPTLGRPLAVPSKQPTPTSRQPLRTSRQPMPTSEQPMEPAQATQIFTGRVGGQSLFSSLVGARDEAWRTAFDLLGRRPVLGSGFGTGDEIFAHDNVRQRFRFFVGAFDPQANVHDAYLQELLELGIIGGAIFVAPALAALVLALLALRRGWRSSGEGAFATAAVAAVVCAVFESMLAGFGAMTMIAWLSFAVLLATRPRSHGRT
jgi:hypothetical protein